MKIQLKLEPTQNEWLTLRGNKLAMTKSWKVGGGEAGEAG